MSVHAKGRMRFGDEADLVTALKRLTLHYENNDESSSTVFDNLPVKYRESLMKAIVAFEMEITSVENVFKLSQNRDEKSYDNIVAKLKLQEGDARTIGELMEQRRSKVFHK
jgi:transcriptional regulator